MCTFQLGHNGREKELITIKIDLQVPEHSAHNLIPAPASASLCDPALAYLATKQFQSCSCSALQNSVYWIELSPWPHHSLAPFTNKSAASAVTERKILAGNDMPVGNVA